MKIRFIRSLKTPSLAVLLAASCTFVAQQSATAQPENDDCAAAIAIAEGTTPFATAGATTDGIGCDLYLHHNNVWFAYTATVDGIAHIWTNIFVNDSILGVYDDCMRTTSLGCNDDCGPDLNSGVILNVESGTTYYIEIGNYTMTQATAGDLNITVTPPSANPVQVWSGEDVVFTKPSGADWTLPQNQDQIAPSVSITRQNSRPIFNIAQDAAFDCLSPSGTRWALGRAVDWQTLNFKSWLALSEVDGTPMPPSLVGREMVLHIIEENIYLDYRLTSWGEGGIGGFSHARAAPPPPCPCEFDDDPAQVNIFDLLAFLSDWFAQSGMTGTALVADFEGDGDVDIFDLLAFLSCWFPASAGGCA